MRIAAVLFVIGCLLESRAQAQHSAALSRALQAYERGLYDEAAVLLQHVVEGDSEDTESSLETAQFFLAKTLVRLGFTRSALGLFEQLSQPGRAHTYAMQSLPWLLQIAREAPQLGAALDLLGRCAPAEVAAADALSAADRDQFYVLRGEYAYREGELERALSLLSQVKPGSDAYLRARFLIGVSEVRRKRARPAIEAFKEIVRNVDEGDVDATPDAQRLRELAWLSLGRIYYTAAHASSSQQAGALVGSAVEAWSRVDPSSEFWLDALFESAWALFISNAHARALGNLHALLSPYFRSAFYPEAHLLRAVIMFDSCQMDDAMRSVERFHREYDPLRAELTTLLERSQGAASWTRLFAGLAENSEHLPPRVSALLQRALADRELQRAQAEVLAVASERTLLEHASEALRQSSLNQRILEDLAIAGSFAEAHAGELARARVQRLLDELQDVANQADTVEIEVLNYLRGRIGKRPNPPSAVDRSVQTDSEHVLWAFNGEYWRDELGYYRQALSSRCDAR